MKTTQGAAHNHIMPTTQVPHQRNEPKTFWVTCSYFTTLPLRRIKAKAWTFTDILQSQNLLPCASYNVVWENCWFSKISILLLNCFSSQYPILRKIVVLKFVLKYENIYLLLLRTIDFMKNSLLSASHCFLLNLWSTNRQ